MINNDNNFDYITITKLIIINYFHTTASEVGQLCYNDAQCKAINQFSFCKYIVPNVVGTCACDTDQFIDSSGRCVSRIGKYY